MSYQGYVMLKQYENVRRFRKAGAVDARTAKPLTELRLKPDKIFQNMEGKGVFRPGIAPGTYYLDENAAEEFVAARRRRAFYMMLLGIIVAAIVFLISRR